MSDNVSRKLYKWICLFILMFIAIILETTLFSNFRFLGAAPKFIPFIVAAVALLEGAEEGAIAGVVGGFLCDALYSGYEGFYTVALPVIAVLICLMNTVMYWKNYGMSVLDWAVLIFLSHLARYCLYMLAVGRGSIASLLYVIPGELVATFPLTPFIYIIISKIIKFFEVYEEN